MGLAHIVGILYPACVDTTVNKVYNLEFSRGLEPMDAHWMLCRISPQTNVLVKLFAVVVCFFDLLLKPRHCVAVLALDPEALQLILKGFHESWWTSVRANE